MRILCLDVGTKKFGIAISNLDRSLIFPVLGIRLKNFNGEEFFSELKSRLSKYWSEISEVVVGDGKDLEWKNEVEKIVDQSARILKSKTNWKVTFYPEVNSSSESREFLSKVDYSFKKKQKWLDSFAALMILNDYLKNEALVSF